jgi:hypothetical protein
MTISDKLRTMEVNEVATFPCALYNNVREACYRMKVIRDMRFKTNVKIDERLIYVTRTY